MSAHVFKTVCCLCVLSAANLCCPTEAEAELIINLDFSSFSTGAPSDGSAILGGASLAQAQTNIESAAQYWEAAFANSNSSINWSGQGLNNGGTLTQTISVEWQAHATDGVLAKAGTNWSLDDGRWGSGTLSWDNDGTSVFFVDSTPSEHSEWNQFTQRSEPHGSVSMNSERVHYDAPAGVARDNIDMLTVAVHEIGHALGFLGAFPAYSASDIGSDGDIDITSGVFSGAQVLVTSGHTDLEILTPAGGDFPYDPGEGSFFPPFEYYPNVMGPGIGAGTRKLLTEVDIAIVAEFLEFDMSTVNFNPQISAVPEPSSLAVLGIGGLLYGVRRRRKKASDGVDGSCNLAGLLDRFCLSVLLGREKVGREKGHPTNEPPNARGLTASGSLTISAWT